MTGIVFAGDQAVRHCSGSSN